MDKEEFGGGGVLLMEGGKGRGTDDEGMTLQGGKKSVPLLFKSSRINLSRPWDTGRGNPILLWGNWCSLLGQNQ